MELVRVIVITRHGDRTPLFDPFVYDYYWNCSFPSEVSTAPLVTAPPSSTMFDRLFLIENQVPETLHGNCMVGQLTPLGQSQHLALGQNFRKKYVGNLLSSNYSPDEVYIETTSYSRTIQSAESQMTGLFPFTSGKETIKMYQQDQGKTDMYLNWFSEPYSCPKIPKLFKEIESSQKWIDFQKKEKYYKDYLCNLLNLDSEKFEWMYPHDSFDCMRSHEIKLPKNLTQDDVDHVENNLKFEFYENYYQNYEVIRLGIGHFLNRIIDVMKIEKYYKFLLYSAHDVTIGPITFALGLKNFANEWEWPKFAANLVFEVYKMDGKKYLRLLYNGIERTIKGCSVYCSLDDFVKLLDEKKYLPGKNWEIECGANKRRNLNVMKMT